VSLGVLEGSQSEAPACFVRVGGRGPTEVKVASREPAVVEVAVAVRVEVVVTVGVKVA